MNENMPIGAGSPDFFDAIAEATLMMCLPAAPLQVAHQELSTALSVTEGLYPEQVCEFLSSREIQWWIVWRSWRYVTDE